jgi:hypothetical protein
MEQTSLKANVNYSDIPIPQFVDIILSGGEIGAFPPSLGRRNPPIQS